MFLVVYTGNGIRQVGVYTKSKLRFHTSVKHLFIVATQTQLLWQLWA